MGNACSVPDSADQAPPAAENATLPPQAPAHLASKPKPKPTFDGVFVGAIQLHDLRRSGVAIGDRIVDVAGQDVSKKPVAEVGQMFQAFKAMPRGSIKDVAVIFQKKNGQVVRHIYDGETIRTGGIGISVKPKGDFDAQPRGTYHERLVYFFEKHEPANVRKVDEFLRAYKGKESDLFRTLERKYGEMVPRNVPKLDAALLEDCQRLEEVKILDGQIVDVTGGGRTRLRER